MMGQYWAQPEGQRLTFAHGTQERGLNGTIKKWKQGKDKGPVYHKMIEMITERPMTIGQIKKALKIPEDQVRRLVESTAYYNHDVWEERAFIYSKRIGREVGYVFVGRGDNYKILEPEWRWNIE